MKGLLKILAVGFVLFMALAMSQEWEVFSSAWFGQEPVTEETEIDGKPAADVVHLTLTLMGHLYSNGGDRRFAERIPAADGVIEEMLADIDYLARNHRRQEMSLERLEVTSVETTGPDRIEIRTREYWDVRFLSTIEDVETDPPLRQTVHGKFLVALGGRGWRVEGWEVLDPRRETVVGTP